MKILLVEDDRLLAQEIAHALRREHFAVDVAANGEDGQHLGETEAYDAAVLDLGLPKLPRPSPFASKSCGCACAPWGAERPAMPRRALPAAPCRSTPRPAPSSSRA